MAAFYELMPDMFWHLKEYHEYFFFTVNEPRFPELRRLEEYEHFDIRLLPFPGSEQFRIDAETTKHRMAYPQPLYFTGNFETVENTDYPVVDAYQFPVVSRKLLSVLESVNPQAFTYEAVPVTIFDFLAKDPFLPNGALRDGVKRTTAYVYLNFFPFVLMEKPRFDSSFPEFDIIEPDEGLDPVFRVRQLSQRLFITAEARKAIDAYNRKVNNESDRIKGFRLCPNQSWDYVDYAGAMYPYDCNKQQEED
jgi:hypothetical protein